ncbi:caspase recruitment domain-containing protein 17-like isoform X2 [Rhinopithecus roxellana]|uniref:caspase recruitment domain-containing protein 17-like isoform X2 n=1 Tax=Rhinopithecus roxellana TaxID=61622 RepID=UPI001237225A|nr:caspase recruitment domain-containing protein 17-like isoform X2 [Rhinopithecus roxellana]
MADKVLKEKRKLLIRSMGEGTINGLLDELLQTRVLNQEEMEKVKRENATVMDKARALLDSVIRKGAPACHICITYICEEDSHLAGTLGLSAGPTSGNHLTTQDSQLLRQCQCVITLLCLHPQAQEEASSFALQMKLKQCGKKSRQRFIQ